MSSDRNRPDGFDGPPPGPPQSARPGGFASAPPPPPSAVPSTVPDAAETLQSPSKGTSEPVAADASQPDGQGADQSDLRAAEVLKHLFAVVVQEAERNPRFAEAMVNALPEQAVVDISGRKPARRTPAQPDFDPHAFSLVSIYQRFGEEKLREKLDRLTKDQIVRMADAQQVSLSNNQKRRRKAMIITATLKATKARLADRFAASG